MESGIDGWRNQTVNKRFLRALWTVHNSSGNCGSAFRKQTYLPASETDWETISSVVVFLAARGEPSPVIELNRAVAVQCWGPSAGRAGFSRTYPYRCILNRGDLTDYQFAHSAKAELVVVWENMTKPASRINAHCLSLNRDRTAFFGRTVTYIELNVIVFISKRLSFIYLPDTITGRPSKHPRKSAKYAEKRTICLNFIKKSNI